MGKENLKYLVAEYKLAKRRLDELRSDYTRIETALDVHKELERELSIELKRAKLTNDQEKIKFWQHLIDDYLAGDRDIPAQEEKEKAKDSISGDNYARIVYYERKLIAIKKILGQREAELLEGYMEKNILMGESQGGANRLLDELQEKEEEKRLEKKKRDVTFDKM